MSESPVVVVTGGAGAIGAAVARSRLLRGDRVVSLDTAPGLPSTGGEPAPDWIHCDISDESSVARGVDTIIERHGRIDHIVAAAGVMSVSDIERLEASEWRRVSDVNLLGLLLTCRFMLPHLPRGGSVSIVSSAAGVNATTITGIAYAVSKAAGIHLARMLAAQYATSGIRVNAVCPGAVETSMSAVFPRDGLLAAAASNPSGRILGPEDVAAVIDFLIDSGEADVTGQVIAMGSPPR